MEKTALVTGGSKGIGLAVATELLKEGFRVAICARSVEELEDARRSLGSDRLVAVPADLAEVEDCRRVVDAAVTAFGSVDAVINNAGIVEHHWFDEQAPEHFRRNADVHYLGTIYVCKAAWPHFQAAGYGRIVNTTSEAIIGNVPKGTAYSGAKGGVFAFTRALALDGIRHGVRVNAVAPRGNTRMSAKSVLAHTFDMPEETFDNPFMDQMTPEKVSPSVAYLAHDSCSVNGETFISGMGMVARLTLVTTSGLTSDNITPEAVANNLSTIMDMAHAQVQNAEPMSHGA